MMLYKMVEDGEEQNGVRGDADEEDQEQKMRSTSSAQIGHTGVYFRTSDDLGDLLRPSGFSLRSVFCRLLSRRLSHSAHTQLPLIPSKFTSDELIATLGIVSSVPRNAVCVVCNVPPAN
ncbi:hypothetical protein ONZ51_g7642 [Trametes cubensis]|uniref:Uncharacterized protein n=1 Tax=Trametes cubensis TaxID=1111947 RepID=A0AAD7TPR7_9APHY|nr:hypothetical protein ONZ51_g7642 [Trametes cubensis]